MSEALISSSYKEAVDFKVTRQPVPASTNKTNELSLQSTFTIPFQKSFSSQYNCIYLQRLRLTRHTLAEDIRSIAKNEGWSDVPICERLVDAIPDTDVVVIGTLYVYHLLSSTHFAICTIITLIFSFVNFGLCGVPHPPPPPPSPFLTYHLIHHLILIHISSSHVHTDIKRCLRSHVCLTSLRRILRP